MTASATSPSILDRLVQRAHRLYSLPAVAMQVLELTDQATIDTTALKECIQNDPALTTKILRVVNSSLFGVSREVSDLNQALALLGTKPLKLLVLGFSLPEELLSDVETEVLQRYWQHTLVKSVAAREVSELVWDLPGDEAFIAGLLQDIGSLVLIQSLGESYITFLDNVYQGKGDLVALEMSTLGFDHAILSARLLDHWKLPAPVVRAVGTAHDVQMLLKLPESERALPQILHIAELIARFLTHKDPHLLKQVLSAGQQYQQLSHAQLEALVQSLEQKVPQLAEILSLHLPDKAAYSTVLADAHRQLADVAVDAAVEMCSELHDSDKLLKEARELGEFVERFVGEPMFADEEQPARGFSAADPTQPAAPLTPPAATPCLDEPGLAALVAAAVAASRMSRCALSLAFVELDEYESTIVLNGMASAQGTVGVLGRTIVAVLEEGGRCAQVHDARFVVVLQGYDRTLAVETIRDLLTVVRQGALDKNGASAMSISAGLATLSMPPKNFPPRELIDAAERCLDGVQLSGGDGLKSIEIY